MLEAHNAGIRAFTCGDIYTGVEELYGDFLRAHCMRGGRVEDVALHTTLVPDMKVPQEGKVDKAYVKSVVTRSLNRFGLQRLHLVQYYWWDTSLSGWLEAAQSLQELKVEGLVQQIGASNFTTEETRTLLDAGVDIATTQVLHSRTKISISEANTLLLLLITHTKFSDFKPLGLACTNFSVLLI